jgi:hypothetical protein
MFKITSVKRTHGIAFIAGLETGHFFVAQLFFKPARPGPGPKDMSFTKKFFPIEFEDHFGNHQN